MDKSINSTSSDKNINNVNITNNDYLHSFSIKDAHNGQELFNKTYEWAKENVHNFYNLTYNDEPIANHIKGVYKILEAIDIDLSMTKASVLFAITPYISNDLSNKLPFTAETLYLSSGVYKLLQTTEQFTLHAQRVDNNLEHQATFEILRKMLLACAQDIRAIVIMLASQLQRLRYHAEQKTIPPALWVKDVLHLYAPLANRLGIWQLKWEMEDLSFRFMESSSYRQIASLLDEKRIERENFIEAMKQKLVASMQLANINADISGRPKHIYSIWKKMHGKNLSFTHLYDVRAFRIIVDSIKDCYGVLGIVHSLWSPIPKEFDDYISQPKPNGYQSLHTVVIADDGRAIEIQIRTNSMHQQAEFGVAAHWRYKEAGTKGYAGEFSASGNYEEKIAIFRQLLEWKEDDALNDDKPNPEDRWEKVGSWVDDHIYVFTPQAKVVALPIGATALDFAYHIHTNIGHRCRGARIDGKMVPLYTILENGQTVEVMTVKDGGPSRNWLRNQPVYLVSNRAKSKVRAWFNALEIEETINKGRSILDKILQREGKMSINLDDLSHNCRYKNINELLLNLGKDLLSPKYVEEIIHQYYSDKNEKDKNLVIDDTNEFTIKTRKPAKNKNVGINVMGVDSLVIQLAKCCKPIPGDKITGFITRGKGITIHRDSCLGLEKYNQKYPERLIETQWNFNENQRYIVDLIITANDRQGLLRDISDVFSREKINVISVQTKNKNDIASMIFSIEIYTIEKLKQAKAMLQNIKQVISVKRK